MAYCTIQFMKALLPKTITIGDTNITTPVLNAPVSSNSIDTRTAQFYINFATQEIDSRLSTVYVVPLKRIKTAEVLLTTDCQKGSVTVKVADNGPFVAGVLVRIGDLLRSEVNEVKLLPDNEYDTNTVTLMNGVSRNFTLAAQSILSVVAYPDPVPLVCARLAVATVIDRLFVAEQDPDVSNYGKSLRTLASNDLDEVMAGGMRLNGQDFVGRRFVRTSLRDTMNTSAEVQRGGGKEG
jgi:hypothetical protein